MSKVQVQVTVVSGKLMVDGQVLGDVTNFIPDQPLTLTLVGDDRPEPGVAAADETVTLGFDKDTLVYLDGDTFKGSGKVEKMDNGDVVLRMAETGKRIRVFAHEVDRMLSEDATMYVSSAGALEQDDTVYLNGQTFQGAAVVETFKDGDAILRMAKDERSGREGVRIRITPDDYTARRVIRPSATVNDFAVGDSVVAQGNTFVGEATVLSSRKTEPGVSVRMTESGRRVRFDANDVAGGRLVPA